MPQLLSLKTEIFIGLFIIKIVTIMEAMNSSLLDDLHEAWTVKLPQNSMLELFPEPIEDLLKTSIVMIVLIRAITIHIYLASHLLIIIPLITEKMRFAAIIWLVIAGFRSIIVNLVGTIIGFILCSSLPELHASCFKFVGIKGIEIGCTTFMWLLVNSYLHKIGRNSSSIDRLEDTYVQRVAGPATNLWAFPDLHRKRRIRRNDYEDSDSGESLISLVRDTVSAVNRKQVDGIGLSPQERSQKIATSAVYMFFENTFGVRFIEDKADLKDDFTRKFMDLHHVEIERFIIKIENYINERRLRAKCIHRNCLYCKRRYSEPSYPKQEQEKITNYGMYYADNHCSSEHLTHKAMELKLIKKAEEKLIKEISILENKSFERAELELDSHYINQQISSTQDLPQRESYFDHGSMKNDSKGTLNKNKFTHFGSNESIFGLAKVTQTSSCHDNDLFKDKFEAGPSSSNAPDLYLSPNPFPFDCQIYDESKCDGSGESIETKKIVEKVTTNTQTIESIRTYKRLVNERRNSSAQTRKISRKLFKKIEEQERQYRTSFK